MKMRAYIAGKCYTIDSGPADGYCTDPNSDSKQILLPKGVKNNQKSLEIIIHEVLHASKWNATEEKVDKTAQDIAKILWKMKWRLHPSNHG